MKVKLGDYIQEYSVRNKNNEDIPVYSVTNTQGFCKDYFGKEVASKDKKTYKIVPRGYFAYNPSRINVGSVDWQRYEDRVIVSPLYNVFSVSPLIDPQYLYHYLKSKSVLRNIRAVATGSVRNNLKLDMLKDFFIELPNMKEQYERVDKLAAVLSLIEIENQKIEKYDELVKARFVELFIGKGYPLKTVDEVSLGKGEYGAQSASAEYDPARPRYVRITDINDDGTLNDDVVASINPADDEQYKLEYGDFMFARMGATVGKTYAFIEGNQIFAGYLIRYRLNQELINPRYLFWYTRLDEYWNWVKLNQSGAAQPGINAKKYGSLQIPLPPIKEQNAFAAFVEQTDKSKSVCEEKIKLYTELYDKLMNDYFGG